MLHFSKTAIYFFMILFLRQVNKNSFLMNLVSQLAALVCQPGVHRNINKKSGDLAKFWQKLPGHDYCGVTLMRRLSRVWVRGGWPAHAQCAYVEPREIQPRGALSCSDCQGRQAWFCRSADLQRAGLLAQVLGQRELAIATIRSSVEVPGSVCDVPGVPCEDRWFDGRKQQHARWQWGQCFI